MSDHIEHACSACGSLTCHRDDECPTCSSCGQRGHIVCTWPMLARAERRQSGNWGGTAPVDMRGVAFKVGDRVAKAIKSGYAVNLELATVSRLDGGKVYLSGSKVPVRFPGRCLIVQLPN